MVKRLKEKGIQVYGMQDGEIVEELPDGTMRPFTGSIGNPESSEVP